MYRTRSMLLYDEHCASLHHCIAWSKAFNFTFAIKLQVQIRLRGQMCRCFIKWGQTRSGRPVSFNIDICKSSQTRKRGARSLTASHFYETARRRDTAGPDSKSLITAATSPCSIHSIRQKHSNDGIYTNCTNGCAGFHSSHHVGSTIE